MQRPEAAEKKISWAYGWVDHSQLNIVLHSVAQIDPVIIGSILFVLSIQGFYWFNI